MTAYNVDVNDATQQELLALTSKICGQSRKELEKLMAEAQRHGREEQLRNIWKQDVEDRIAFNKDQKQNGILLHAL